MNSCVRAKCEGKMKNISRKKKSLKTLKQKKRINPKSKGSYLGGGDVEGTYILEGVNKKKVCPKLCKC